MDSMAVVLYQMLFAVVTESTVARQGIAAASLLENATGKLYHRMYKQRDMTDLLQ